MIQKVLSQNQSSLHPEGPSLAPTPSQSGAADGRVVLTPRQAEVLNLLCQGLPSKTIGRRLNLSENTVRWHVQALLTLLKVTSRTEAVFVARRNGLID
jgi:DNA-binding NarL/FixJ family response regulator